MSGYVCQSLTAPDAAGLQNCSVWIEQPALLDSLAITPQQAETICASVAVLFAVAWVFAKLRQSI